ncbi:hypothetical protein A2673_03760 [Candidatus Kaiserbacteria bacterium RIFCSPHIGHO2_01_FULL_50_13]|uniref:HD domain-containing protein n=1 Tax=Candidatus Kaiserbacteria bacterium RIFCSPLOWO2_01_FULL_50_24 TaxID=1798507 RepID=A0A1F6EIX9_9BACT|nr:MAG: hypothetical protein A2673_03760 [Candidatus Kaiserbacteria bacterium RIFCSPHIGHO2_01_FULL_50_13]OGG73577.1 MAG: hypothetical protein A3A34_02780 [Candidatus Kaiserbacteria bacterium RIFCSPLOWO2_01_FULL_50_24]OGG82200.1 MAG: hypothetical protein A3H74_03400 [Candidatus Kaiserbacteria bacterium RIFCSPLOWO2_02_FULL_51_13]
MQKHDFDSFITGLKEKLTPLYTMPNSSAGHDVWHVMRVAGFGKRIRKCCNLTFDSNEFEVAVWLHNIDRVQPYADRISALKNSGHSFKEALGVVAESFFTEEHPFSADAVARIIDVVVQHNKKDDEPGDSHVLTALRIADKLDRLNPLGIMSAAAFRGLHVPPYDTERPLGYGTTVEGRMKSVYDDFFRVLEWVNMLPSDRARSLINKKDLRAFIDFVRALGAQLARECKVENTVEDDIKKALGTYYPIFG